MTFANSPGVYDRIQDESFVVSGDGQLVGGIIISSDRGPVEPTLVTSARQFVNQYGLPTRDNPSKHCALRFLNRATALTVRRVINDALAAEGTLLDDTSGDPVLTVTAANPGAWGNNIEVSFGQIIGQENSDRFTISVSENGTEVEQFEVSRDPEAQNGFGTNIFIEEVVNNRSRYIRVDDDPSITGDYDFSSTVSLSGGQDDTTAPSSGDIVTAWDDFTNVNNIQAQILINAGWAAEEIQTKMLSVAETRRDSVAILDVPEDTATDVQAMIDYRTTTLMANTEYGGLYGGWLRVYDQYNDREIEIPSSGDVAGVFVHTVEVAERWDAPAGLRRGIIPNALGVSKVFTEGERDQLYLNGINPVTSFAGTSAVVWGQKTLQQQASALDRFNVVNSVIWMSNRMQQALQPFIFEPNTEFTRDNVNYLLSSFLETIQTRGGLYDFFVDTSTEINTPTVIDNNQMIVNVYLKPTRTAEFIRLNVIITPTGVDLQEQAAA